ncbi:MAG: hypothetical protein R6V10_04910 [bacterium]
MATLEAGQLMAVKKRQGEASPFDGTNMKAKHRLIYASDGSTLQTTACTVSLPEAKDGSTDIANFWDVEYSDNVVIDCKGQEARTVRGVVVNNNGNYFPALALDDTENSGDNISKTFVMKVGAPAGTNIGGGAYADESGGTLQYYDLYRLFKR